MRKIGILGLNTKAESTLKLLKKIEGYEIAGIYDSDMIRGNKVAGNAKLPYTNNPFGLINGSDLLIIPKTDEYSYNLMVESILNSKQVLIENPVNLTLSETEHLSKLASEASVSIVPFLSHQFSHCLINTKSYIYNPGYVHILYSSALEFKQSQAVRSEVLLTIIDLSINIVKANVKRIYVNAVKVVGTQPQLIILRLEYDNGCTVNISIDFISNRDELTISVYQPKQIVTIDILKGFSLIKSFSKDNIFEFDVNKISSQKDENPYQEVLEYIETFESINTPLSLMESFKHSLAILKKVEDKMMHSYR